MKKTPHEGLHRLHTNSEKEGSIFEVWNIMFYIYHHYNHKLGFPTFEDFLSRFVLTNTLAIYLPSNDHGKLVNLSTGLGLIHQDAAAAMKHNHACRAKELSNLKELCPPGTKFNILAFGANGVTHMNLQLSELSKEDRKSFNLVNNEALNYPCTFSLVYVMEGLGM